jgi:hypothetical protein
MPFIFVDTSKEISFFISNILLGYLGFITSLNITYIYITSKKGIEFKKNSTFLYNCLILFSVILLFIFMLYFLFYVDKLIIYLINQIIKVIKDFILKMLGINPSNSSSLGGSMANEGGGKPPRKPHGPNQPFKGHYVEKEKRKRANYSKMTPEEIKIHKEELKKAKNERRRVHNLSKEQHDREIERDRTRRLNEYNNVSPEEERRIRDIYNAERRIQYSERKDEINERRREIFADKSDDEKEFIRENDRERYHSSTYMRLRKQENKRRSRANLKDSKK